MLFVKSPNAFFAKGQNWVGLPVARDPAMLAACSGATPESSSVSISSLSQLKRVGYGYRLGWKPDGSLVLATCASVEIEGQGYLTGSSPSYNDSSISWVFDYNAQLDTEKIQSSQQFIFKSAIATISNGSSTVGQLAYRVYLPAGGQGSAVLEVTVVNNTATYAPENYLDENWGFTTANMNYSDLNEYIQTAASSAAAEAVTDVVWQNIANDPNFKQAVSDQVDDRFSEVEAGLVEKFISV